MTDIPQISEPDAGVTPSAASVLDAPSPAVTGPSSGDPNLGPARSLWSDAWDTLRRSPMFWISAALIVFFLLMAMFPQLFTSANPETCDLVHARQPPGDGSIFGYDLQSCDIFARTIYGARSSILVGLFTTLLTALVGTTLGVMAGYMGGLVDTILSRIADVFFAIPLLLGAASVAAEAWLGARSEAWWHWHKSKQ